MSPMCKINQVEGGGGYSFGCAKFECSKIDELRYHNLCKDSSVSEGILNLFSSQKNMWNYSPLPFKPQPQVNKGQLISEGNFGVFKSSKSEPFFVRISALASKIGQI